MSRGQLYSVMHFLRRLADEGPEDRQLLEKFARQHDEAAFATLLRRHGPLVLGVCRRMLGQEQDVEDVFQATFLVLARKAAAIRKGEAVASWLYSVATRLARRARADAARRPAPERQVVDVPVEDPPPEIVWRELRPVLDEEINALPSRYRAAFVLCHLQGKTNEQAAGELGCPLGTVLSRLSRARALLRQRLMRRGVTLSAGLFAFLVAENATPAAVPAAWTERTMKAAMLFAAGRGAVAGPVSAHAALLAQGVLHAMFLTRLQTLGAVLLVLGLVATAVYSRQDVPDKGDPDKPAPKSDPEKTQYPKGAKRPPRDKGWDKEQAETDPNKAALQAANKLLEEEIEDEKAKLEALKKKLDRLKANGIKPPAEDPELAKLRRENRKLQQELKHLQEDVHWAEEEVQPYVQALRDGAGSAGRRYYTKEKGNGDYPYNPYYKDKK
jgi:RNA polymerase sigma factor (sigma-70 family)